MKLSIIILSFNTKKLILDCLKSVFADSQDLNLEVIVIDNASTDGSPQAVKSHFPQVKLIQNKTNLGFAQGNNQGINQSGVDYVLLLNSDTIIKPQALKRLVEFMDSHPQVGIAAPQLLNPDGSIQPNGGYLPRLSNIMAWMLLIDDLPWVRPWFPSYQLRSSHQFQTTRPLGWVQGAAMVLRRQMLDQIGLLDEQIFMYAEDVDICYRAKQAHWQVMLAPQAQIIHLGFRSSSPQKAILGEYQGLKHLFKKYKPAWELPILNLLLKTGALLRLLIFGTIFKDKSKYDLYRQAISLA